MKFLHLLHSYMKGVRLIAFALVLLMTWAVLCSVTAYGRMQNIQSDIDLIDAPGIENAYLLTHFLTQEELLSAMDSKAAADAEKFLEADPSVKNVFTVRVVNPVSYNGKGNSIILYEPEMLEFFPGMVKNGIDFSLDPNGVVLGSLEYNDLDTGDMITLSFSGKKASFPVTGHLYSPYRRLVLSVSATNPYVEDLFTSGGAVFMQSTDMVMAQLESLAKRIRYDTNVIVVFRPGTTAQQREALVKQLASNWQISAFTEILARSKEEISKTLRKDLPLPLFLAVVAATGYISIIILVLKNKEQHMALMYLCGGSRLKCGCIAFTTLQSIATIPLLLNGLFIYYWPKLSWTIDTFSARDFFVSLSIPEEVSLYLASYTNLAKADSSCYIVLLWYFLGTVVIALSATVGVMRRYTPISYLKGASR